MGKIVKISIVNYRSIRERIDIQLPSKTPLVLIGENNSGKSNIIRALDLLLGESWPGNYELSDHEFHKRDKQNKPVQIQVELEGVTHTAANTGAVRNVRALQWSYSGEEGENPYCLIWDNGQQYRYVSKETREQCLCIVVAADRRLSYQLSYASKYTFLSKLMRRFHDKLVSDPDRVKRLKEYFNSLKGVFSEVEAFTNFTEELNKQVMDFSENLDYGLKTDFSAYDPSNYYQSLKVLPYQEEIALNFEELGTGQEQILALSFIYAYAKAFHGEGGNIVLVVEEPEAHLHPLAQRWLAQKIHQLSEEEIQVIVTTHSPAFINLLKLNGIVLLSKVNGATRIKQLDKQELADFCIAHGVSAAKVNKDNVLNFYSVASTEEILSGFFARKIVLVEGESEALALPAYLSRLEFNVTKEGIAIIAVHGKGNIAKWWRLYTAYGIPTYVIFDNDTDGDEDERKRKDILNTLGISEENQPQILTETAIKIENQYSIFGTNFETALKSIFGDEYSGLEDQATQYSLQKRQSKPLIARYIAERIFYDEADDRWQPLRDLAQAIQNVSIPIDLTLPDDIPF